MRNAYGYVDGCKARQSGMLGGEGFPDNIEEKRENVKGTLETPSIIT